MPPSFLRLASEAAATCGFANFAPDACLINRYEPAARMSLHQDRDEQDFAAPIVSVSLGLPAVFLLTNRIFSPQFFVVVLTCCACAAALTGARRVFVLLAFATVANAILFPGLAGAPERAWASVSALALLPAGAAVASLAGRRAR